jgi:hypothetical protein
MTVTTGDRRRSTDIVKNLPNGTMVRVPRKKLYDNSVHSLSTSIISPTGNLKFQVIKVEIPCAKTHTSNTSKRSLRLTRRTRKFHENEKRFMRVVFLNNIQVYIYLLLHSNIVLVACNMI